MEKFDPLEVIDRMIKESEEKLPLRSGSEKEDLVKTIAHLKSVKSNWIKYKW